MKREWKTGDVALVTYDNATGDQRAQGINRIETQVALVDTEHVGIAEPADAWFVFGATTRIGATWESVREVRPLVVIDPEDREQVERLRDSIYQSSWDAGNAIDDTTALQAALREFADPKPPRPEEPTGLGAVVEGITIKYIRIGNGPKPWMVLGGPPESRADTYSWSDLAYVTVLSEGVVA